MVFPSLLCCFILLPASLTAQVVSFGAARNLEAGAEPGVIVVADFNGDGQPDLVVANQLSNSVSVLLNNGAGIFQPARNFIAATCSGCRLTAVASGDFNGDGKPDLAVVASGALSAAGAVSILLGNGNGTFQAPLTTASGNGPVSLAVADFNADGVADLAVANQSSNDISLLLGIGNGTFRPALNIAAGSCAGCRPRFIVAADFNGDGRPDLAVAASGAAFARGEVLVLLGNGHGAFQTPLSFPAGDGPVSMAMGDFNADGNVDLAVANERTNSLTLLLGIGNGSFRGAAEVPVGTCPGCRASSVAGGDFNGDGAQDLVVTASGTSFISGGISVLLGNGNGTFLPAVNLAAGNGPAFVALGDFNDDGKPDLAVANQSSNNVSILLNAASGSGFSFAVVSAASGNPPVAPESLASIFGRGLAVANIRPELQVRDSAGKTRRARLIFVSPQQINFEAPPGLAAGRATLKLISGAGTFPKGAAEVRPVAPGLFTADGSGRGVAAAVAGDQTPIFQCSRGGCVAVPIELSADTATILTLYGTGIRHRSALTSVSCTINGISVPVLFAGPQEGVAGLDRVTVSLLPELRGSGPTDLVLTVDGQTANTVRVNIQ
jgi:uncharacterized protein (TIGR03437 family)